MNIDAMRFAYADPPYPGQARRHYQSEEVDHRALVGILMTQYPDGWALSTSSPALREVLSYCPDTVRIAAWVKPWAIFKVNVNPGYTWEPLIFHGGRKRGRDLPTVRDFLSCNATMKKGLVGAKPRPFCEWVIDLLGAQPGDTFADLFPGTGIFTEVAKNRLNSEAIPVILPTGTRKDNQ